jgi:hypothetical protein
MSRPYLAGLLLVVLLTISALTTCLFAARWFFAVGEVQRLQLRAETMTRTSAILQQLVAESVDHARTHPPLQSLLNQLNLRAAGIAATNSLPPPASSAPGGPMLAPRPR